MMAPMLTFWPSPLPHCLNNIVSSNAANAAPTLARSPYLPVLGPLAEQWVSDE